jgi:hypothetical protein
VREIQRRTAAAWGVVLQKAATVTGGRRPQHCPRFTSMGTSRPPLTREKLHEGSLGRCDERHHNGAKARRSRAPQSHATATPRCGDAACAQAAPLEPGEYRKIPAHSTFGSQAQIRRQVPLLPPPRVLAHRLCSRGFRRFSSRCPGCLTRAAASGAPASVRCLARAAASGNPASGRSLEGARFRATSACAGQPLAHYAAPRARQRSSPAPTSMSATAPEQWPERLSS